MILFMLQPKKKNKSTMVRVIYGEVAECTCDWEAAESIVQAHLPTTSATMTATTNVALRNGRLVGTSRIIYN